jgi:hypothetical protein
MIEVVEGQTARVLLNLLEDGAAFDATGFTVSDVLLTTADGRHVDTAGKFGWSTQASAIAYYDPATGDFASQHGPYRLRVKVTDGSSKIRFYPGGNKLAEVIVGAQR